MKIAKAKNRTIIHETPEKCNLEQHHFVRENLREQIEKKAYELYQGRGYVQGRDLEDWLKAEKMVAHGEENKQ
jgi:hypothetical protein